MELKRSGKLSPSSKKRLIELRHRGKIKQAVFERDGGCLLSPFRDLNRDGQSWGPCVGDLTPHHLLKASHGGKYTLENLVTLCELHNDMIEDYPDAAYAAGLVIKSWEELDEDRHHLLENRDPGPGHVE